MKAVYCGCVRVVCLCGVMVILSSSYLFGQADSSGRKDRYLWVNCGVGGSSVQGGFGNESTKGVSIGMSLSYLADGALYSIRGTVNSDFKLNLFGHNEPSENVWDFGALYGRALKKSYGMASISAGVGLVGGSANNRSSSLHPGIPFEAQLYFTPMPTIGFGISGFANLNSYKSFSGVLICFQYGRRR
jgi:hypothetical protein